MMLKMHKCKKCSGPLVEEDGIFYCSLCGLMHRRFLKTSILSYNTFVEKPSNYTRKYRFKCLLNELCGRLSFPDDLAKIMLDYKDKIISPKSLKDILYENKLLKKHGSKIAAVLIWLGVLHPPLNGPQIRHCCSIFQILDREISIISGKKPAFTFLIPIVLRLAGQHVLANSQLLREPSKLLIKKYGECTKNALISLKYPVTALARPSD